MKLFEIVLIAIGLSMDASAVAVCLGLKMQRVTAKRMLTIGIYFGVFQAMMPLIGYYVASIFADKIIAYDHWIAFILLLLLGGRMILEGLDKKTMSKGSTDSLADSAQKPIDGTLNELSLSPSRMLPYAIATSIDALAIGVSFAFLSVEIFSSVAIIGVVTLLLSMVGVKIGNMFGSRIKSKAELLGGIILIIIGIKILLEHLL